MSLLQKLRAAKNLHDVAPLLGFIPSALSYILYIKPDAEKYHDFEIGKRGGGFRKISSPVKELKLLQKNLANLLQDCQDEIYKNRSIKDEVAHGFKRSRSILSNARRHRARKYVFNIDLTDFFGSINFGRIRGFFIKDHNFELQPAIATIIAQIACRNNSLPQGSPCSPIISNLIGRVLDVHLIRLTAKSRVTYTRYADDLTFSTSCSSFPKSIAIQSEEDDHKWLPGKELTRLIEKCGFSINPQKTRMQYSNSRQEVTGLIVNRKVNVRTEYRRTVRAMVHRLFTKGEFELPCWLKNEKGEILKKAELGTTNQLRGMLGFIDEVDRNSLQSSSLSRASKDQKLSSKELMYRRFLLFKEFYTANQPVIICEGKTDNVYIRAAIRRLASKFPQLASPANGKLKIHLRIFKYPESSTGRILRLNGGVGDLSQFILDYYQTVAKFQAPGGAHPVIVLVDNDSGTKPLFSVAKQITSTRPDKRDECIEIAANLYLVPLPLKDEQDEVAIEDFFDEEIRSRKVDGRAFDPKEEKDTTTHYSKNTFAERIVRAEEDVINFDGFEPILARIVSVINRHAIKQGAINSVVKL